MAGFSSNFVVISAIFAVGAFAEGELDVIHSPSSLKWTGASRLRETVLKEIYSASLGLSVEESSNWSGLSISDPFSTPEAVVEIYVNGVSDLGNVDDVKWKRYPISVDEYSLDTYPELSHRIKQRYVDGGNTLVDITLNDQSSLNDYASIFGNIKINKHPKLTLQYLKPSSIEEDAQFLQEINVLKAIAQKVESGAVSADNVVDFYQFRVESLHPLSDLHGADSLETKEAKKLLADTLEQLSASFTKAYDGSVLVTAVSSDVAHTRRATRSLKQSQDSIDTLTTEYNLASSTDSNYPAIFNIILWFSLVMVFSLISIVYALIDMDPGRDSIIYRMTSNRMKKDN